MDTPGGNGGAKAALQAAANEPLPLRVLLAFSASTVLTGAVAVPMAYQAHLARQDDAPVIRERRDVSVLGTTTIPGELVDGVESDGIVFLAGQQGPAADLHGATVSTPASVVVDLPGVRRVDFVLDEEPATTDFTEPWELLEGDPDGIAALEPGEHVLTATVTFEDERVELRRARFTVAAP